MPAGQYVFFDKAALNMFNATNLCNPANQFKMSLHTSAMTPDVGADEVYADVDSEIAAGNGYTAGGIVLAGASLTQTAGVVKFTHTAPVWTAAGGSIPAWRIGLIRVNGTLNGKVNPLVGYFIGDTTAGGTDIPATTDTNTLTVTPHASGVMTAEQV